MLRPNCRERTCPRGERFGAAPKEHRQHAQAGRRAFLMRRRLAGSLVACGRDERRGTLQVRRGILQPHQAAVVADARRNGRDVAHAFCTRRCAATPEGQF